MILFVSPTSDEVDDDEQLGDTMTMRYTYGPHQKGRSLKKIDYPRKAKKPGKRTSKTGHVYYEFRRNRSDLKGRL